MTERCETCRFWKHIPDKKNPFDDTGVCRRRAPEGHTVSGIGSFPVVGTHGWCGEWEAGSADWRRQFAENAREAWAATDDDTGSPLY